MNDYEELLNSGYESDLLCVTSEKTKVIFQHNKLKSIVASEYGGKALRVKKNGKLGMSTGSSNTPFKKLLSYALETAEFGKEVKFDFYKSDEKEDIIKKNYNVEGISLEEIIDLGNKIINKIKKEKPNFNIDIILEKEKVEKTFCNVNKIFKKFEKSTFLFIAEIQKVEEGDILTWFEGLTYYPKDEELEKIIQSLISYLNLCEKVVSMESGKKIVLFHPISLNYILRTLREGLNAQKVYEKLSPLTGKIGERILDERITLIDDPLYEEGLNFSTFDDEGVKSKKNFLIKEGVLNSYMSNLDYAFKLGILPSGNGYRRNDLLEFIDLMLPVEIHPTNWIIPPHNNKFEDMMASISNGVFLLLSWDCILGNLINGDFSGTIHIGFNVKNGKPIGRIKNMRITGNIYDMLGKDLIAISKESLLTPSGTCNYPYILAQNLTIA